MRKSLIVFNLTLFFLSYQLQAQGTWIKNKRYESESNDLIAVQYNFEHFRSFFSLPNIGDYILTDNGLHLYKKDSIYLPTLFAPTHFVKDGNRIVGIGDREFGFFDGKTLINYNKIRYRPLRHDAILIRDNEPADSSDQKLRLFLLANNSQSIYLLSSTELLTIDKSNFTIHAKSIRWGNIYPAFNDTRKYPEHMLSNEKGDLIITLTYAPQILLYKDSVWLQGTMPLDFKGVRKSKKLTKDENGSFYISCPETLEHFKVTNAGIIRANFTLPPHVTGFNLVWIKNETEMAGVIDNEFWIQKKGVWKKQVLSKQPILGRDFMEITKSEEGLFYLTHLQEGVFIVK